MRSVETKPLLIKVSVIKVSEPRLRPLRHPNSPANLSVAIRVGTKSCGQGSRWDK